MAKTKTPSADEIKVTLAKGESLSGPAGAWGGGDTLTVPPATALRMHQRGLIEPLPAKLVKDLLAHAAADTKETAQATPAKETAQAPVPVDKTAQDAGAADKTAQDAGAA